MCFNLNKISEGHSEFVSGKDFARIDFRKELLPSTEKYSYLFEEVSPERLHVCFKIPNDAVNAFVSLNGSKLCGFFSDKLPEGSVVPDAAKSNKSHETTLAPGETQTISFKWLKGDLLEFYIYYDRSQ